MHIAPPPPPRQNVAQLRIQKMPLAGGDAYVGSARLGLVQPPSSLHEWSQRLSLARGMLDKEGPAQADAGQQKKIVQTLTHLNADLLRLARSQGVSVGVVSAGRDVFQMGALQPRTLEDYQAALPAMRQQVDRAIASLPSAGQDQSRINDQLDKVLDGTGLGAIRFTVPLSSVDAMDSDAADRLSLAGQPKSTRQMASLVGAQTPEEIQEYTSLVEALNGPRLQQAREESLQRLQERISRAKLEELQSHPERIPVSLESHHLFVPNLFYAHDQQGHSLRVDLNDACSYKNWASPRGLTLGRYEPRLNPDGTFVDGQYFPARQRLLVQAETLSAPSDTGHGDTTLHELGHALEIIVQAKDPAYYGSWQAKIEQAHRQAQARSSSISDYALTNPREYVAEGLAHYFKDPTQLKAQDPTLYQLSQQFLQHARSLAPRP